VLQVAVDRCTVRIVFPLKAEAEARARLQERVLPLRTVTIVESSASWLLLELPLEWSQEWVLVSLEQASVVCMQRVLATEAHR
jgi:hypothetical protein